VILVVDDDDHTREMLCAYIRNTGYEICQASSAMAGYDLLLQFRHNVRAMISDMIMPNGGGWDLVRRSREIVPNLPVLFISGILPHEVTAQVCNGNPPTRFLPKPVELSAIKDLLASFTADDRAV
jgi:DNA-binding NtrC family response regulator